MAELDFDLGEHLNTVQLMDVILLYHGDMAAAALDAEATPEARAQAVQRAEAAKEILNYIGDHMPGEQAQNYRAVLGVRIGNMRSLLGLDNRFFKAMARRRK